jgi:prevent-host-death family protein
MRRRPSARRPERAVSATEAAKNFGRIVDLVREGQVEYVVERAGVPVAKIAPATERSFCARDLVALLRDVAAPDPAFGRAVETGRARLNRPAVPTNPWES